MTRSDEDRAPGDPAPEDLAPGAPSLAPPALAHSTGNPVDAFSVGSLSVTVRYGCVRRDQYELIAPGPFPATLQALLSSRPGAELRGTDALFIIDMPGVHQITVATARGRMVVMPRLSITRPEQRAAVLALCELMRTLI